MYPEPTHCGPRTMRCPLEHKTGSAPSVPGTQTILPSCMLTCSTLHPSFPMDMEQSNQSMAGCLYMMVQLLHLHDDTAAA